MKNIKSSEQKIVERIESHDWPKDTAGRKMIKKIPVAFTHQTLGEVQNEIYKNIKDYETLNYIYVIDNKNKLKGIFSIKDLYRHPPHTQVNKIAKKENLITIRPNTDQERVVYLALKNNIKAVPVINESNEFLGVIPSDTILGILYKEAHEDILRLAGVHHRRAIFDNILEISLFEALKHRLPWLFIGLGGGVLAAYIINIFETTLEKNLILAAYIPLIIYMSGAVAIQAQAFVIRDLAIDHKLLLKKYFLKQLLIISSISVIFGLFLFFVGMIFHRNWNISYILGISLFSAVITSVFSGVLVPFIFNKLKLDPANASGPLTTIIQDILGVIVYLSIASWLL